MPEYEFTFTIAAAKTKAAPATLTCKLNKGVIQAYELQFPHGCNDLVFVAIDEGGHQFAPANPEEAFHASGYVVHKEPHYHLNTEPFELKLRGWSPDCTYAHKVTVRFDVLPEGVVEPWKETNRLLRAIARIFGAKVK